MARTKKKSIIKSKKQANYILQRIYRIFIHMSREGDLYFKFSSKMHCFGKVDWENNDSVGITIHPDREESLIGTIIHECLHLLYEKAEKGETEKQFENRILQMEREMMYWLSDLQKRNLFIRVARLMK